MTLYNHHLKRSQHFINSSDHRPALPSDEAIRESIENFSRLFQPGPFHARRGGGGGGRTRDYSWYSSVSLPKRAINYDLAESFVDHSTNPLSSDLYKIHFKHSPKQWRNGRFANYIEKLDKLDGNIIDIRCTRSFPVVLKRKKTSESQQNTTESISSLVLMDPDVEEQKKKLADKQTNFYANLFGIGKIAQFPSSIQIKKTNRTDNSTASSSTAMVLLAENKEDHQC